MELNRRALYQAMGIGAAAGLVAGIVRNIAVLSIACLCLGWLYFMLVGASYGYLLDQRKEDITNARLPLGGLIAGATSGVVWGIVGGIMNALLDARIDRMSEALLNLEATLGWQFPPDILDVISAGSPLVILLLVLIGVVVNGLLGLAGGALFQAYRERQLKREAASA